MSRIFAVVTAVIFLNMSFFLTEVRLLELHLTHREMVEKIVKVITGSGVEEEREAGAESSESTESKTGLDYYLSFHTSCGEDKAHITASKYLKRMVHSPSEGCFEILVPPPKSLS